MYFKFWRWITSLNAWVKPTATKKYHNVVHDIQLFRTITLAAVQNHSACSSRGPHSLLQHRTTQLAAAHYHSACSSTGPLSLLQQRTTQLAAVQDHSSCSSSGRAKQYYLLYTTMWTQSRVLSTLHQRTILAVLF